MYTVTIFLYIFIKPFQILYQQSNNLSIKLKRNYNRQEG